MLCDIARNLDDDRLTRIQALESDLGITLVAFTCRTLDPEREERIRAAMKAMGPVLQAEPAELDDRQLGRIRASEASLGVSLVAVDA